jgi:hypothetical protein
MTQPVRTDEHPATEADVRTQIDRLVSLAARSHASASFVGTLLESAADAAERHAAPAEVPVDERGLWERVGADFGDAAAAPRSRAKMVVAFAELLGRSVRGDAAVAEILGVDRSRISQRVAEPSLYAVAAGQDRCYPEWQFNGPKVLRGLRDVLAVLDHALHPLTVDHWFTTDNLELLADGEPTSPVTWLATGGTIAAVVALADGL